MARKNSNVRRTPDSGYKFECQACEEEVFQGSQPELVFAIVEGKGRGAPLESIGYQCCEDCAFDIKADNAKFDKKRKEPIRQVRALRESGELDAVIPESLKEAASNTTDAKLDKLIDTVAMLAQLMSNQLIKTMEKEVFPPMSFTPGSINTIGLVPTAKRKPVAKPKRAILAPPKKVVKKNAPSKTTKSTAANKVATKAKPKPRRRR